MKPKIRNDLTCSENQRIFLQNYRRNNQKIKFYRVFVFVLFLGLWELSADQRWIDVFFFSSPSRILNLFYKMICDLTLVQHLSVTLFETISSFFLVQIISIVTATVMWYSPNVSAVLEPYLVVLNSLPKSALAPLLIVWLGTGTNTIIVAGISVALFGSVLNFYTAFRQCDPEKLILIRTLGGSRRDTFFKVVFPSSVPLLFSTTKVNIGLSLVGVIIGEFLAAKKGLGYLIIYGSQVFQMNLVIMNIILLCFIAMLLYYVIQKIEKRLVN